MIDDPRVAAVTLTGSEGAGAAVARAAGGALKKTVLELGGSDPFVVLPCADLGLATKTAVSARIVNNGQSCIAAKRFIVHRDVHERFVRGLVEGMRALRVGEPHGPGHRRGPARLGRGSGPGWRVRWSAWSATARACSSAGSRWTDRARTIAPTVLVDVPRASPAYQEELFGPVALVLEVRDLDEAIEVANEVPFGLGASVWTADPGEQARLVDELEAGATFVNGMVISDPRLPFGGVKRSGYGRELSREGIREFVNVKTVVIQGR